MNRRSTSDARDRKDQCDRRTASREKNRSMMVGRVAGECLLVAEWNERHRERRIYPRSNYSLTINHNQRHVTITIVSHRDDDCLCNLRRESVCNRKLNKTPPYRELSIQPAVWTRALASLVQHRSKGGVNCVLSAGILVSKGCFRFTIRLSEKGV